MRLIDDAGRLWHRFWSVRFNLLSIALQAVYAAWQAWVTGNPPWVVLVTIILSAGSLVSRLVAQPKLTEASDG